MDLSFKKYIVLFKKNEKLPDYVQHGTYIFKNRFYYYVWKIRKSFEYNIIERENDESFKPKSGTVKPTKVGYVSYVDKQDHKDLLKVGTRVRHTKHDKVYAVISSKCRFKDSEKGWVDAVTYMPLYENELELFMREIGSFCEEFEILNDYGKQ